MNKSTVPQRLHLLHHLQTFGEITCWDLKHQGCIGMDSKHHIFGNAGAVISTLRNSGEVIKLLPFTNDITGEQEEKYEYAGSYDAYTEDDQKFFVERGWLFPTKKPKSPKKKKHKKSRK